MKTEERTIAVLEGLLEMGADQVEDWGAFQASLEFYIGVCDMYEYRGPVVKRARDTAGRIGRMLKGGTGIV